MSILNAHTNELPDAPAKRRIGQHPKKKLTAIEESVLEMFSRGKTYKQVAAARGCSEEAVNGCAQNIYRFLGVHDKTEAVAKWMEGRKP